MWVKRETNMAAKPKPDGSRPSSSTVRRQDFNKLVANCENAPRASVRLRSFVSAGQKLLSATRH